MTSSHQPCRLTHILIASDIARSRRWYTEVLGAELYPEYGGDSDVFSFNGSWLLLVTGGSLAATRCLGFTSTKCKGLT